MLSSSPYISTKKLIMETAIMIHMEYQDRF